MDRKLISASLVVLLLSALIASCAPAATPAPEVVVKKETQIVTETQVVVVTPTPEPEDTEGPIKIGMSVGVTGAATYTYVNEVHQVRLAIDEINEKGGVLGRPLELVLVDDAHDPKQAVIAAHALCDMGDIVAVLAHGSSGCAIPASAVYNQARMPAITHASSPMNTQSGFDNFFQNGPNGSFHGIASADVAYKLGVRKVSVVYEKTMWGQDLADEFKKRAEELGMEILSYTGIDPTDVDLLPILTSIKSENPDGIFTACYTPNDIRLRKQKMALGMMDLVDVGGELVGSEYLNGVGEAGNGAYTSVGSVPLGLNEDLVAMGERLFERVGQYPEPLGLKFYEATYIFADAIERAGTTEHEAVIKAVSETDMTGPVTHWHLAFDEWGRMKYPVTYMMKQTAPGVQELGEIIEGSYPPQES